MNKEILELELEKQKLLEKNLERKIERYKKANNIVINAISKEEIEDTELELKTVSIQRKILENKIKELANE